LVAETFGESEGSLTEQVYGKLQNGVHAQKNLCVAGEYRGDEGEGDKAYDR
jgi:hypothetical protein